MKMSTRPEHYLSEGAEQAALGFIEALSRRTLILPAIRPRLAHAHELTLPGLRVWPLTRYPHLVFFMERSDHIDVWRVLHRQRDIPVWMREPDEQ
jgi:toxin ParE1/3/4